MSPIECEITQAAIDDSRWSEALANLGVVPLHQYADPMFAQARSEAEADDKAMEALYAVLGSICTYYFRPEDRLNPYGPQWTGPGGRSAIPDDLRESDLDALKQMLPRIQPASVRGLVADVLWVRRRDAEAAQLAVSAFVEAARNPPEGWMHDVLDQLERAIQLVAALRKGDEDLGRLPIEAVHELLRLDPPIPIGYEHRLVDMLVSRNAVDDLEPCLERAIRRATAAAEARDYGAERNLHDLVSLVAGALGREAEAREHAIAAAETWVAEAQLAAEGEEPSHMRAVGLLEFSIKAYRAIGGCRPRIDQLHEQMLEWQADVVGEMKEYSTQIDISGLVAKSIDSVSGRTLPQAIVMLSRVYGFRDVEECRSEAVRLMTENPLRYLVSSSYLDARGRVVARPQAMSASDDDAREAAVLAEMYNQAHSAMGMVVQGGIEPARRALVAEHPVAFRDIMSLFEPSPFIPPGHEVMYAKGLWFGLLGDYATAAAILAPELENALREQMINAGKLLPRLNPDATQEERSLGEILWDKEAAEVFGDAKLFTLRAVLSSDFGANLRDRIAHGLLTYDEYASSDTAFMWWLALRLAIDPLVRVADVAATTSR